MKSSSGHHQLAKLMFSFSVFPMPSRLDIVGAFKETLEVIAIEADAALSAFALPRLGKIGL